MPVQTLDTVRHELKRLNMIDRVSWRKIAAMDAYEGIPPGSLCSYAKGRIPKNNEHRRILGLSIISTQYKDPITGRYVEKDNKDDS